MRSGCASQRILTQLARQSQRSMGTSLVRLNEQANQPASDKSTPTMGKFSLLASICFYASLETFETFHQLQIDAKLSNLERYLVFKFSSQKYASINDVPESVR